MDIFEKCRNYTRHKEAEAQGLYPYFKAIESGADSEVIINGRKMIMIGSNNYLGLTQHPKVKDAAKRAIDKYGSSCTGSRFLNGTLDLHEELEGKLARFLGRKKCLVFSTGFQTNLGTISALVTKDDYVIIDRMDHASIVDGCRLSFGETIKYKHNDMEDLERILKPISNKEKGILVIVDGVFSMEGDLANLKDLVELKKKYNFRIMLDDAHGMGVMGKNGRGSAEHFNVESEIDIIMGTFSKSFASLGGFIAGDEEVIDFIKHIARSLIFSASMTPSNVASVIAALDIVENDPKRREKLWKNTKRIHNGLRELGFDIGNTESPVVPVRTGDIEKTFIFWKRLFEEGIFVNPIIPPAVPPNQCLLRTSYMATHEDWMIDKVLQTFKNVGNQLGII